MGKAKNTIIVTTQHNKLIATEARRHRELSRGFVKGIVSILEIQV